MIDWLRPITLGPLCAKPPRHGGECTAVAIAVLTALAMLASEAHCRGNREKVSKITKMSRFPANPNHGEEV